MKTKALPILFLALVLTAATFGGGGLDRGINAGGLDAIAPDSKSIPGDKIWGNYLKTPDDMIPRFTIRFDDMGSRTDQADMALEFLKRGIPVTIGVNAWNVDAADSALIQTILGYERQYGTEVQWYQHTNGNMVPDRKWPARGINSARTSRYITDNSIPTTDWRYYSAWHWNDWVAELDPTPIERLTGERPRFVVWPGDVNPSRRGVVTRHVEMFEALFDTLGYEFGITGLPAQADSIMSPFIVEGPEVAAFQTNRLQPFMFADWPTTKVLLPMPSTRDLTSQWYVERGATAKVPWAPPSTTEWTLAKNISLYKNGTAADFTDFAVGNFRSTFRADYTMGIAAGGGDMFVFHSIVDTDASPIAPNYPDGGARTYTGQRIDLGYVAAACSMLVDKGLAKFVTVTDQVKWLASKPGKPGMVIGGTDNFRFPWYEIGDTVGVESPMLAGMGNSGLSSSYQPNTVAHVINDINDTDYDGKLSFVTYVANHGVSTPKFGFLPDMNRGGKGQAIIENGDAFNAWLFYASPPLLPGVYRLELEAQNTATLGLNNDITVQPGGYAVRYNGEYPYSYDFKDRSSAAMDSVHYFESTTTWASPPRVQELRNSSGLADNWDKAGLSADDFSSSPWWTWAITVNIPEPSTNPFIVNQRSMIGARFKLDRSSFSEHPRIGAFRLRWMGPVE